ncbi:malate dehydrogenase [Candidatus Nitrosotenuis aquarius]|uniref:malate dehydrogenase n=1 Tax=Candidatus Nitrosotenuis aquarius TaxID=1846278 RepID=UPI000C1E4167|nr:NAD(P)-binding domain-containing protein [Candidatus Nitrosotenuis aquarius]
MISIIGAGKVGSAIAFLCGSSGLDNIVLVNRNEKRAIGEALDITNAIPKNSTISVFGTSDYSKIKNSDVCVIAASVAPHIKTRSDVMLDQAKMITDVSRKISEFAPSSKVLVVTNPVDVMTYLVQKRGNLASKNVLGIASSLDSARFRYMLAKEFGTDQSQIRDALVMGEHDDSMVPIFSCAKFGGTPVNDILDEQQRMRITASVRSYWKSLRDYKGSSVYGIAKNTFDAIDSMIKSQPLEIAASVLLDGQYGIKDLCMGVPVTITKDGIAQIHEIPITQQEREQLRKSAGIIQNNITQVKKFLN